MNATKRKFNSLLQGLGSKTSSPRPSSELEDQNPASPSLDTGNISTAHLTPSPSPSFSRTTAAALPRSPTITAVGSNISTTDSDPGKRRRLGALASTTGNAIASTTLKVTNITWTNKGNTFRGPNAPEPKFCPGDREQLIRRLATFQELTEWTPKPDKVNEIEWAKRGWACQGKERVRCTLCCKELVVQTNTKKDGEGRERSSSISIAANSEVQEALVNKFAELIVEGHQEDCLWRRRACDGKLFFFFFRIYFGLLCYDRLCPECADTTTSTRHSTTPSACEPRNHTCLPPRTLRRPVHTTLISPLPLQPPPTRQSRSARRKVPTTA